MPSINQTDVTKGVVVQQMEYGAAVPVLPGMVVDLDSNLSVIPNATVNSRNNPIKVVLDDRLQGRDETVAYAAGDLVPVAVFTTGHRFNGIVVSGAGSVTKGLKLVLDATGKFKKVSADPVQDNVRVIALQAVDATSADKLCLFEVL